MFGKRQLHNVAGAVRVLIKFLDDSFQFFLGGVLRQVLADGADADFLAVLVLHAHVGVGGGVVAYEHSGEARNDALLSEGSYTGSEVGEDFVAVLKSIEFNCSHGS